MIRGFASIPFVRALVSMIHCLYSAAGLDLFSEPSATDSSAEFAILASGW